VLWKSAADEHFTLLDGVHRLVASFQEDKTTIRAIVIGKDI
jgi:hypothetical protein